MIDVLVVLVVFLLLTFETSAPCLSRDEDRLPSASGGLELVDAPLVEVSSEAISVDGARVARRGEIDPRGHRIDGLKSALERKRAFATQLTGRPPPEQVILAIDVDTPSGLVKQVTASAASAGYPCFVKRETEPSFLRRTRA